MLKQNYTILFLFFCLFLLISCKNREDKVLRSRIEKAIEIGEEQPLLALNILDSIQNTKQLDEAMFMLYQIASIKAKRNANEKITSEDIKRIQKASEYFEKHEDLKNTTLAHYYTARAYYNQGNINKEFTYYLKAYSVAKSTNDSLMMGKSLYNLGRTYFDQQVYDSTNLYLKRSIPLLKVSSELQVQSYKLLASSSYLKNDYNNGLNYLNMGLPLLEIEDNKQYHPLYNEVYGAIYKELHKYQDAAFYFRKNLGKENPIPEQLRAALNLTDMFTSMHNNDSATYYSQIAIPLLSHLELKSADDNYLLLFGYRVLQDYYIEQDNKPKIKEYIDLFTQKQYELNKTNIAQTLMAISQKMKLEEIDKTREEYNTNICFYAIFTIMSFLMIIFIILISRKDRQKIINILKSHSLNKPQNNTDKHIAR